METDSQIPESGIGVSRCPRAVYADFSYFDDGRIERGVTEGRSPITAITHGKTKELHAHVVANKSEVSFAVEMARLVNGEE